MNESYAQPSLPEGVHESVIKGMYRYSGTAQGGAAAVRLLGCGAILREVIEAAALLASEWNVSAEVWSVTSFTELAREAREIERWNRLHPTQAARCSWVAECLAGSAPVIAATDYVRAWPQLIASFIEAPFVALGTDGFGRSDTRCALRRFFEVDRQHVTVAALHALSRTGVLADTVVAAAIERYGLAADAPPPWML
jgi:pyruvate dehydrogenase E1 component